MGHEITEYVPHERDSLDELVVEVANVSHSSVELPPRWVDGSDLISVQVKSEGMLGNVGRVLAAVSQFEKVSQVLEASWHFFQNTRYMKVTTIKRLHTVNVVAAYLEPNNGVSFISRR